MVAPQLLTIESSSKIRKMSIRVWPLRPLTPKPSINLPLLNQSGAKHLEWLFRQLIGMESFLYCQTQSPLKCLNLIKSPRRSLPTRPSTPQTQRWPQSLVQSWDSVPQRLPLMKSSSSGQKSQMLKTTGSTGTKGQKTTSTSWRVSLPPPTNRQDTLSILWPLKALSALKMFKNTVVPSSSELVTCPSRPVKRALSAMF